MPAKSRDRSVYLALLGEPVATRESAVRIAQSNRKGDPVKKKPKKPGTVKY